MTKIDLDQALVASSSNVLETLFFSAADRAGSSVDSLEEPITCLLHCTGAAEGSFSVSVDRTALGQLCSSFYGEDDPTLPRQQELACELTNMIAGSTLSSLLPEHYGSLTAPPLCSLENHLKLGKTPTDGAETTTVTMEVEGGLMSASCSLRIQ